METSSWSLKWLDELPMIACNTRKSWRLLTIVCELLKAFKELKTFFKWNFLLFFGRMGIWKEDEIELKNPFQYLEMIIDR